MKTYGYTRIWHGVGSGPQGIEFYSTDTDTVESIITRIKERIPSCTVYPELYPRQRGIARYEYQIKKLGGQDKQIALEMIAWLCSEGWEPFSAEEGEIEIRFRKEFDV